MLLPTRLKPLESILRRYMRIEQSLEQMAIMREILAPEEQCAMPRVLIAPEDRARVTKAMAETSLEQEWKRVDGAVRVHQPTLRFMFEDVLATPFGFFVGGNGFARSGRPKIQELLTVKIGRAEKGFYATGPIHQKYFGHWLLGGLPLTLLAQEEEVLYFPFNEQWQHAAAYLDLLNINRIPQEYILFDEMSFCIDFGQNKNRRARNRQIRDRLQTAVKGDGNKLVYLQRGATGASRNIFNEDDLIAALKSEGFTKVRVDAPLAEIIDACRGASTIISVEGSHLAHALLAASEGALHITLNPCDRFNNVFADYMPSFNFRLGTIVMERVGANYHIDVNHALQCVGRYMAMN